MTPTKDLVYPVVNMNGTSRDSLLENLLKTTSILQVAIDRLRECMPHGRDYQTVDSKLYGKARDQHIKRIEAVDSVRQELLIIADEIYRQGHK